MVGAAGPMSRLGQEAARGSPATPPHAAMSHLPGCVPPSTIQLPPQTGDAQQSQAQHKQDPPSAGKAPSAIKRLPYTQQLQTPGTAGLTLHDSGIAVSISLDKSGYCHQIVQSSFRLISLRSICRIGQIRPAAAFQSNTGRPWAKVGPSQPPCVQHATFESRECENQPSLGINSW